MKRKCLWVVMVLIWGTSFASTVPLQASGRNEHFGTAPSEVVMPPSGAGVHCSLNDGMMADGKTALEYGGAKHQFCCSECLDKFKANPEAFSQPLQSSASAESSCSSVCSK